MTRIFKGLLAVTLTCLLLLLWTQISRAEVVDRIVAEVNGEIITLSEVRTAARAMAAQTGLKANGKENKEIERKMLDALIDRKLAKAEAKRRGIQVTDKELAAALADFKKRNNLQDDEDIKKALAQSGATLKELKQNIADQIIQERLLAVIMKDKGAAVSDAEVRQVYESQFKGGGAGGAGGVQLHLRVIKIPFPADITEAKKEELKNLAEKVMAEVKGGASFSEVAKKYSLEETDAGFVAQDDLEPKFAEFLSRLKPKEVGPAVSPQGIQLIQLVERRTRSGAAKSFEEVAPQIRRALQQKGMEKQFLEWIKTLRAKAHIKIML
jgi:peptidyl-prolyl cis-trans isomerase SurA